jgi:hypothetical protein
VHVLHEGQPTEERASLTNRGNPGSFAAMQMSSQHATRSRGLHGTYPLCKVIVIPDDGKLRASLDERKDVTVGNEAEGCLVSATVRIPVSTPSYMRKARGIQ